MTIFICWMAWMVAMMSDKNKNSLLTYLCFFAWLSSLGGITINGVRL